MTNIVQSLCVYETIIRIGSLKHLRSTLKWVKNEYIYEVAGLKSSALLKLESYWAFWRPGVLPGGVVGSAFWVCRAVGGDWGLDNFVMFPNFLCSQVLYRSVTSEITRIYQLISNNHHSFHLWRLKNLLSHLKVYCRL